jgi:hypothetical protein
MPLAHDLLMRVIHNDLSLPSTIGDRSTVMI